MESGITEHPNGAALLSALTDLPLSPIKQNTENKNITKAAERILCTQLLVEVSVRSSELFTEMSRFLIHEFFETYVSLRAYISLCFFTF